MLNMKGKKMRVLMSLLVGYELEVEETNAIEIGLFVELLHNASLIVDDIEDNSNTRRGYDCCHVKFGVPVAVSAANTVYFLALRWVLTLKDEKTRHSILEEVIKEMTNLHLGQNQDIVWNSGIVREGGYSEEGYLELCKHKTGGLLRVVSRCCAALSKDPSAKNRLPELVDLLNNFGILYQIVDDILNLQHSTNSKNKGIRGEDIKEGIKTIIVIHALKNPPPESGERLANILKMKTSDEGLIEEAIQICEESGSIKYAQEYAYKLKEKCIDQCNTFFKKSTSKLLMIQMIEMNYNRNG